MSTVSLLGREFSDDILGVSVRVFMFRGEPLFNASDVAIALGYSNHRDAVKRHIYPEYKMTLRECMDMQDDDDDGDSGKSRVSRPLDRNRGETVLTREAGMYLMVFGSNMPAARDFTKWVVEDVLGTIRREGRYVLPNQIRSIRIEGVMELEGDARKDFRKHSLALTNAAKNRKAVERGTLGGVATQTGIRELREEHEDLKDKYEEARARIIDLETELGSIDELCAQW